MNQEERIARTQRIPYVRVGEKADICITFLDPQPEQIRVKDFALHLAKQCRYLGAVPGWYSNAEHCILGARVASNNDVARQFLIHDAGEYVFGDMPSPIGRMFPDYKAAAHKFQLFLLKLYCGVEEFDPEVKIIDDAITSTEQKRIRKTPNSCLWTESWYDEETVQFYFWPWEQAYIRYMDMFTWLFPEVKIA